MPRQKRNAASARNKSASKATENSVEVPCLTPAYPRRARNVKSYAETYQHTTSDESFSDSDFEPLSSKTKVKVGGSSEKRKQNLPNESLISDGRLRKDSVLTLDPPKCISGISSGAISEGKTMFPEQFFSLLPSKPDMSEDESSEDELHGLPIVKAAAKLGDLHLSSEVIGSTGVNSMLFQSCSDRNVCVTTNSEDHEVDRAVTNTELTTINNTVTDTKALSELADVVSVSADEAGEHVASKLAKRVKEHKLNPQRKKESNRKENLSTLEQEYVNSSSWKNSLHTFKASLSSSESDGDGWEEVSEAKIKESPAKKKVPLVRDCPVKDIQIDVKVALQRKMSKREKYQLWLSRYVKRFQKRQLIYLHKAHVLCLLAKALHENMLCIKPELQAICLSLMPPDILTSTSSQWDISKLRKLVTWFGSSVLHGSELFAFCPGLVGNAILNLDRIHILVMMLRVVGLQVRIIHSLQPYSPKIMRWLSPGHAESVDDRFSRSGIYVDPGQQAAQHRKSKNSDSSEKGKVKTSSASSKPSISTKKETKNDSKDSSLTSAYFTSPVVTKRSAQSCRKMRARRKLISQSPVRESDESSRPQRIDSSPAPVVSLSKNRSHSDVKASTSGFKHEQSRKSVDAEKMKSPLKPKLLAELKSSPPSSPRGLSDKRKLPRESERRGVHRRGRESASPKPSASAAKRTQRNKQTSKEDGVKIAKISADRSPPTRQVTPRNCKVMAKNSRQSCRPGVSPAKVVDEASSSKKRAALPTPSLVKRKRKRVSYVEKSSDSEAEDMPAKRPRRQRSSDDDFEGPARRKSVEQGRSPESDTGPRRKTQKSPLSDLVLRVDSEAEFEISSKPIASARKKSGGRMVISPASSDSEEIGAIGSSAKTPKAKVEVGIDLWLEVYLTTLKKWICIELVSQSINDPGKCEFYASKPLQYVIGVDNDGKVKDVTCRYASKWMTETMKLRLDRDWWAQTLSPYKPLDRAMDSAEDGQLAVNLMGKDLPKSINEYKDHPLYALERHLLKFQAIYPRTAATLGFIRGEAIYARDCVHELHTRETWLKQARTIRQGEEPYKIVKGRPKRNTPEHERNNVKIAVFGAWQTEAYVPPPVVNGKVTRNEYGNVELFQPCMLPEGAVHIPIQGIAKIAAKLNIDAAPAMMGWDFHGGWSHPVIEGVVVAKEYEDVLMDAWARESEEIERKAKEKREKKIYDKWKLLIRGVLIRAKLDDKYKFQARDKESSEQVKRVSKKASSGGKRSKTVSTLEAEDVTDLSVAWPRNRMEGTSSIAEEGHVHIFPEDRYRADPISGTMSKSCSCGLVLPVDQVESL